jgi:hypothetical protein
MVECNDNGLRPLVKVYLCERHLCSLRMGVSFFVKLHRSYYHMASIALPSAFVNLIIFRQVLQLLGTQILFDVVHH